jgi:hypothetical protein
MATRKQRRRRAKGQRHEYEVVYLDDEGNEVEVEPEQLSPAKREARRDRPPGKATPKRKTGSRIGRSIDPPSWRRSARRTLIVAPIFFAFLLIVGQEPGTAFVVAALYSLLFVPFSYGIDTITYRMQLKRLARRSG